MLCGRFVSFFLLFCVFSLTIAEISSYSFFQLNNHEDPLEGSFVQYYWMNDAFYRPGSPVLVYLTNYAVPEADLQRSAISQWGASLQALLIELEVRYSGNSLPTKNFTSTSFPFQSPEQNIEDVLYFNEMIMNTFPNYANSPWILIGEYFNANYAIWTRENYPDVILGSVGIAGPVEARENFPEYSQYFATVAGDFCAGRIHNATEQTELVFQTQPGDVQQIKELFGCTDVPDNTQFFYVIAQIIQFGIGNDREFVCNTMTNTTGNNEDLVGVYANLIHSLLNASGLEDCNAWNIAAETNVTESYRPTLYLDCAYFGQFETAGVDTPTTIVSQSLTVDWYLSICSQVFDTNLSPNVNFINANYGAKNPTGSNFAFVTSTSDPFRSLVVNETSLGQSDVIRVFTGNSIFSFLSGEDTTPTIQTGRDEVLELMQIWINNLPSQISPSPSPSPSSNDSKDNVNWIVYTSITVGIFCLLVVSALIGYEIYKYLQQNSTRI